ncbi:hypothetical protein J5837_15190 [Pseudoxanthomonas helianthi]|uniref:Uncharacterized protein n=1 Tax=Pseudoxanthomonas helianthi TaxID=1453541 RepID=A0A941AUY4_9GAMM|nr:hypothetical protein [Pseudoxanthomonas helianthi]MBP3985754.1 hypothetical protein [Pseudoxanthomonas helianthi]
MSTAAQHQKSTGEDRVMEKIGVCVGYSSAGTISTAFTRYAVQCHERLQPEEMA